MTPEEIAEKINDNLSSCVDNCYLCENHEGLLAAELQAYGLQQRREALEEAAKEADKRAETWSVTMAALAEEIAKAIRSLRSGKETR